MRANPVKTKKDIALQSCRTLQIYVWVWWGRVHVPTMQTPAQRAKKVVSDSPVLVDFAIGIVIIVLNLPDGQVLFFGEIQITEECNQSC